MRDAIKNIFGDGFLWTPFLVGAGAAIYFSCASEPAIPHPWLFAILAAIICVIRRAPIVIRGISFVTFGFMYAMAFTHALDTPQITRDIRGHEIIGNVVKIDYTDANVRAYITTDGAMIGTTGIPRVRVSISDGDTIPRIGDTVRATVNLYKPGTPYAPGAFNYARWAYFNNLTATGYMTEYEITTHEPSGGMGALREYLHQRAESFLGDSLVLGYKNAVPKSDRPIWTAAGVGHVWSISGFHMTLVGGWLFALFYSIFRLIAPVTRRIPARVPATICAWVGLMFYLVLSGGDVATMRAFLMASLVFGAFLVGRGAISMRNICIAMFVLILINPHYVMQAGFQLSFSAVFGLIWFWGVVKPRMPGNKLLKILYTATMTSVVATIFTAPFVIAHFGAFPMYSLVGNLVLLPIFSIAIMPLVMIGIITAPIGFTFPLHIADFIYEFALHIAGAITSLPFANPAMPYIPNVALVMFIAALCALIFMRRINYIVAGALGMIGIIIIIATPRPVFYASPDHELVAFVSDNGKLEFNKSRAANHYFAFNTWKQMNGEPTDTPNPRRAHNHGLYTYRTENFTLAYIQKFVPLMKNINALCQDASVNYIVSYFQIDAPNCNHKILGHGGILIYPDGRVKYLNPARPWDNPPK